MTSVLAPPCGRSRLAAELEWLRLLTAEEVARARASRARSPEAFLGFTIDDAEIDRLLAGPSPADDRCDGGPAVAAARAAADRAAAEGAAAGVADTLDHVASCFGLSGVERDLLLVAAAPDLDEDFETLYAYLHDDIGRRRPSVGLAGRLLAAGPEERWDLQAVLAASGPLARFGLVRVVGDAPRLARSLVVPDRVLDELLGHVPQLDDLLLDSVVVASDRADAPAARSGLEAVAARWRVHGPGVAVLDGHGARDGAWALGEAAGAGALRVRLHDLAHREGEIGEVLRALWREARLRRAVVVFEDGEELASTAGPGPGAERVRDAVTRALAVPPVGVVVVARPGWPPGVRLPGVDADLVTVPGEGVEGRRSRWERRAAALGLGAAPGELDEVAARFALDASDICEAAGRVARDGSSLLGAAREQAVHGLGGVARRVDTGATWDDLVVAPATGRQLRELATVVRALPRADRSSVAWRAAGLSFLFAGPSGTGKSLAASVLANDLGLDLYAIDLATVVSKYIGETEKQLRRVFEAARLSNAVLFFDEADALFGKRSEVSDAHDRYANIEVAYLLQQMEAYEGVAILATNLSGNLDDAFARRMHQVVEFPFPDAGLRRELWEVLLRGAACDGTVDPAQLAPSFELAGGNIRNAVVHARLLATAADRPVREDDLVVAVAREYQKLGRHPSQAEFGQRFPAILDLLGGA